jgi:hypothetical protein
MVAGLTDEADVGPACWIGLGGGNSSGTRSNGGYGTNGGYSE